MSQLALHLLHGLGFPRMFESNNGTGDRHNLFSYDESCSLGIYKADRPGWQCQRVYTTPKSSSGSLLWYGRGPRVRGGGSALNRFIKGLIRTTTLTIFQTAPVASNGGSRAAAGATNVRYSLEYNIKHSVHYSTWVNGACCASRCSNMEKPRQKPGHQENGYEGNHIRWLQENEGYKSLPQDF